MKSSFRINSLWTAWVFTVFESNFDSLIRFAIFTKWRGLCSRSKMKLILSRRVRGLMCLQVLRPRPFSVSLTLLSTSIVFAMNSGETLSLSFAATSFAKS